MHSLNSGTCFCLCRKLFEPKFLLAWFLAFNMGTDRVMAEDRWAEVEKFTIAAQTCFIRSMTDDEKEFQHSAYTEAYIAQHIMNYLEKVGADLSKVAATAFCSEILVPKYKGLRDNAIQHRQQILAANPVLAKLSEPIELDNQFIESANNIFLDHTVTGHTDLTWRAIDSLRGTVELSEFARKLIVDASQMPDLYRWEDERYHAHTCQNPDLDRYLCLKSDGKEIDRAKAVTDSREIFIKLVSDIIKHSRTKIEQHKFAAALFWVGVGCHAVQDLAYHRGITLRQHAGLSLLSRFGVRDPDLPRGEQRAVKEREGADNCAAVISAVLTPYENTVVQRLSDWSPSANEGVYQLANREFAGKPDMNATTLVKYQMLAKAYVLEPSLLRELVPGKEGLIDWSVAGIMSSIHIKLGSE
jgi:hypothetical protein